MLILLFSPFLFLFFFFTGNITSLSHVELGLDFSCSSTMNVLHRSEQVTFPVRTSTFSSVNLGIQFLQKKKKKIFFKNTHFYS